MSNSKSLSAITDSKDERDRTLVIREVTPEITIFSTPFVCSPSILSTQLHSPPLTSLSFLYLRLHSNPVYRKTRYLADASNQTRGGAAIGGRSTAIRLPTSEVFLYVSTPHTPATAETISQMGEVKWLVTPDGKHGMFIQEFVRAYPDAKYVFQARGYGCEMLTVISVIRPIGVAGFEEKFPDIKWAGLFGAGGEHQTYGFEPHVCRFPYMISLADLTLPLQITLAQVTSHMNHELLAIHHASGTLLEADMLFNLPPTEQFSRAGGLPFFTKLFGGGKSMSPGGAVHGPMVAAVVKDKQ